MKESITKILVIVFSLTVSLVRRKKKLQAPDKVRRIAVMQMSGIGDLLLITPALCAIHNAYPLASIDILTYRLSNADFLFRFPGVSSGCEFPLFDMELKHCWKAACRIKLKKVISFLRSGHYDLFINFHHTWLAQWYLIELLVVASSGAGFRVGINPDYVKGRGVFDVSISEAALGLRHYRDFFLDILDRAGIPHEGDLATEFPLRPEECSLARKIIEKHFPFSKKIICVHPGASHISQQWPADNFQLLCKKLIERGCGIIFLGTKSERKITSLICHPLISGSFLDMAGQTDLYQMAALINESNLFIGNDSGPMHVAIALKCPTIGLIGPGKPRYHAYRKEEAVIVKNEPHSFIDGLRNKETAWKWHITVDQVFNEAVKILS